MSTALLLNSVSTGMREAICKILQGHNTYIYFPYQINIFCPDADGLREKKAFSELMVKAPVVVFEALESKYRQKLLKSKDSSQLHLTDLMKPEI